MLSTSKKKPITNLKGDYGHMVIDEQTARKFWISKTNQKINESTSPNMFRFFMINLTFVFKFNIGYDHDRNIHRQ
jgi:hypothetical protein